MRASLLSRAVPILRHWHLPLAAALAALLLSACGGGSASDGTTPGVNQGKSGPKTLIVEVDGVAYAALREALAQQSVAALASLNIAPAWTGGQNGTLSEQRTTAGPGWASLVTGTWAQRHGVRWDTPDQRIAAATPTLFELVKKKSADYKTAVITSSALNQSILDNAGKSAIDSAIDCAGADACVTERTGQLIDAGHDLLLAQFGAPAAAAASDGLRGGAYQKALSDTSAAIGQLLAKIARRSANDAREDWLVIVTTGHGLDAFGSATGLQAAANKTVFIASNKVLPALPGVGTDAPADESLQTLAASTDIAPTVLRQMGALPAAADYRFNGVALQSATSVRSLGAKTGRDKTSIELAWTLTGSQSTPVQILRDGQLVATLAAGATAYTDAISAASDGNYAYTYSVVAGEATLALTAQIAYVKPVPLAPTLLNGLVNYYPLDALPALDVKAASTLAPWAADADGATLVSDDGMKAPQQAKALRVDSRLKNAGGMAGYRLLQTSDVTSNPAVTAFTIGFWLRSDASCSQGVGNGGTVMGNKNYDSGNNAGLAVGLFGSCELRFNTGTGSARGEIKGLHFLSAGQWAYMAVVIDKTSLNMTGYLFDPVKGTQTGSVALNAALISKLSGLGNGIGLNEDGTGLYYQRQSASPRGAMDFNDFAVWNRALTSDELISLYKSAQPLSMLNP